MENSLSLQGGKLLYLENEASGLPEDIKRGKSPLWKTDTRPRVTLDRASAQSHLFFIGHTQFGPDCGLWFGVQWLKENPEEAKRLESLFEHLADSGLGGDRSSGFGAAQIVPGEPCHLPDADGVPWVSLSRYIPTEDEIIALQHPSASYAIQTVGGWVSSPGRKTERRRAVRMLAEGSVLGPVEKSARGMVVDVRPNYSEALTFSHPVWRSGMAVGAGIRLGEPAERT